MRQELTTDTVERYIEASPEALYDFIADVTRTPERTPDIVRCEWLDGATGPAVDARFRGHVKRNGRGPTYWTTCTVTECGPGESFFFAVSTGKSGKSTVNTWGYRLAPTEGGGTDVTESFQLTANLGTKIYWALAGKARGRTNENGMRTTLERIKAEVERPA